MSCNRRRPSIRSPSFVAEGQLIVSHDPRRALVPHTAPGNQGRLRLPPPAAPDRRSARNAAAAVESIAGSAPLGLAAPPPRGAKLRPAETPRLLAYLGAITDPRARRDPLTGGWAVPPRPRSAGRWPAWMPRRWRLRSAGGLPTRASQPAQAGRHASTARRCRSPPPRPPSPPGRCDGPPPARCWPSARSTAPQVRCPPSSPCWTGWILPAW